MAAIQIGQGARRLPPVGGLNLGGGGGFAWEGPSGPATFGRGTPLGSAPMGARPWIAPDMSKYTTGRNPRTDGTLNQTDALNAGHTITPWAPSSGVGPSSAGYRGSGIIGSAAGHLGSKGMPTSVRGRLEKFGPNAASMTTHGAASIASRHGLLGGGLRELYDNNRFSMNRPAKGVTGAGAQQAPAMPPVIDVPGTIMNPASTGGDANKLSIIAPPMPPLTMPGAITPANNGINLGAIPSVISNPLLKARKHGGPVEGGMPHLVGEEGPEVFVPKKDGMIVPNLKTLLNKILLERKS